MLKCQLICIEEKLYIDVKNSEKLSFDCLFHFGLSTGSESFYVRLCIDRQCYICGKVYHFAIILSFARANFFFPSE